MERIFMFMLAKGFKDITTDKDEISCMHVYSGEICGNTIEIVYDEVEECFEMDFKNIGECFTGIDESNFFQTICENLTVIAVEIAE